ncbi:hypothetical protein ABZ565_29585 [Streptomyces sp. NPDC016469]|uniref:hypothetical protein n=1 Tax=Streptomyces sp. NPDC016469 TaxID=3157191 RepID=UPI0033FC5204
MKARSAIGIFSSAMICVGVNFAVAPHASAVTFETDYAVKTSANPNYTSSGWWYQGAAGVGGNEMSAFQSYGDVWWLLDGLADGKSVAVKWWNMRNGKLIRQGVCINNHGSPSWAKCNKDFAEDSTLEAETCLYESSTKTYSKCNGQGYPFRVSDASNV